MANNERGQESTVNFNTPVATAETVLIAEDEDGLRDLVVKALKGRGYHTLTAANGAEAVEISQTFSGQIDLVVTDVVMPQMGGQEFVSRLLEMRPNTKVIYVSGYSRDLTSLSGSLASGQAFLQKPYTLAGLATLARELLDRT